MFDAEIKIPVEEGPASTVVASVTGEAETEGKASTAVLQMRMFLMLLATFVAVVTFRAGLIPPKGFWPDSRDGHFAGESVFLSTHPKSFRYFMLCNGMSFFTSLAMLLFLVYDRLYSTPMKMTALTIIAVVDLSLLVCAFVFGTCPEQPLDGLWYLLYAVTICGTIFLAVYLVRVLRRDAEKQLRKRAKRAKSIQGAKLAKHGDGVEQGDYKHKKMARSLHGCSFKSAGPELAIAGEDKRRGAEGRMEVTSLESVRKDLGRPPYLG